MRRLTNSYDDVGDAIVVRPSISSFRSVRSLGGTLLLEEDDSDKGSVFIGVSLFMTIVGTGMLAMPLTLMKIGLDGFIASILIVATCTIIGYYFTYRTLDMVPSQNMDIAEIGKLLLGKFGFYISLFICVMDTWGTIVGNVRAVTEVIMSMDVGVSEGFVIALVVLCAWPLTFKQKLSDLRVAGLFATCAIFLFTGYVTWEGLVMSPPSENISSWNGFHRAAPSLGVILFSFDSQVNLYPLYREMRKPSGSTGKATTLTLTSIVAVLGASFVYIVVGISGVMMYPDNINGNVLVNMRDEWFVKASFATAIFLSLPILAHECTVLITRYLAPFAIHGGPSLFLLAMAGYAANSFHMFSAFRYVGSTTGVLFSAVLPPLFFISASRRNNRPILSQIPAVDSLPLLSDSPLASIPRSTFGRSSDAAFTGSTCELVGASLFLMAGIALLPILLSL